MSFSFDPVAEKYDATRGLPEQIVQQVAQALDQAVNGGAQTRFLEVGVGTGRIAVPLAMLGRQYTGIDISEKMLGQLFEKLYAARWQEAPLMWGSLPDEDVTRKLDVWRYMHQGKQASMRLLIADMTDLPFHDRSFDAVIASHVFHLVPDWQKALQEIVRVLQPGGMLLCCWNEHWHKHWQPGSNDIRQQWTKIVQESGGNTKHPGASDQEVIDWLERQGFVTEQWSVLTWQEKITPRAIFEGVAQRLWTSTRFVPDDLFAASIQRLRQWMDEHYGAAIDDVYMQERRFVISRTRV
jgi:ubiquinone/menaquinone biosynthesis C-methylase UbiE